MKKDEPTTDQNGCSEERFIRVSLKLLALWCCAAALAAGCGDVDDNGPVDAESSATSKLDDPDESETTTTQPRHEFLVDYLEFDFALPETDVDERGNKVVRNYDYWLKQRDFDGTEGYFDAVWGMNSATFYCECPYEGGRGQGQMDADDCDNYDPYNAESSRQDDVDMEHVAPISIFTPAFGEDRADARRYWEFNHIEADLYNLRPAIGEINSLRGSAIPAEGVESDYSFGACDIKIDASEGLFEPPEHVRGDIARTYFYMLWTYEEYLTEETAPSYDEFELFLDWHRDDPVDCREFQWATAVAAVQQNENPFIALPDDTTCD